MATSYAPGVQTTVSSFELSMSSVFHPAATKVMTSTPLKTLLKRPRLEFEEETLTESTFTAQDSDVMFDPAEGETSVTEAKDLPYVSAMFALIATTLVFMICLCVFLSEPRQAVLSKTYSSTLFMKRASWSCLTCSHYVSEDVM